MNDYYQTTSSMVSPWINFTGEALYQGGTTEFTVSSKGKGIHPTLYFKYIKKKFSFLEKRRLDTRLKKLEKAFYKAVDDGQEAFAEKFLNLIVQEARESAILAKGIKHFIEKEDLNKHKNDIRDGHISDTQFKDFTRVIPKKVLDKKKNVEDVFDGFVIYHYWNQEAEKGRTKKQRMTEEEKNKMKDPVLFGWIKENNRLYFIADWEDEFCDLTIDEIIDVLDKDDEELTIQKEPSL